MVMQIESQHARRGARRRWARAANSDSSPIFNYQTQRERRLRARCLMVVEANDGGMIPQRV